MDSTLYKLANQGNVHGLIDLVENDSKVLFSKTPRDDTALHIAAKLGHKDFADEILRRNNGLLIKKNADEDTPLHMAARAGHLGIVASLINYALVWTSDMEYSDPAPLRMTNKLENTPLHEAVTHGNHEVAMKLLKAERLVWNLPNTKKESPLHIAAREGIESVVREILNHLSDEKWEDMRPPLLHEAIRGGHISVVELLLRKRKDLIAQVDEGGNNALHYAAQTNNGKMVETLLKTERSLAYSMNLEGRSPLHVAAAFGSTIVIKELLKHCLDTAEQVDGMGQNALHIAVMNRTVGPLKCLLKNIKPPEIINQVDGEGNTPLHLAAQHSRIHCTLALLKDKRVNPCITNTEGLTPRKIIESFKEMDTHELYIWEALKNSEAKRCKKPGHGDAASLSGSVRKKLSQADEHYKSSAETYTVVAALIATVAFAATFTMPGGYNQSSGKAILAKHPAFKAFVISNTIAMCSSLIIVFCFIWAWKDPVRFKLNQLTWGHRLTVVACLAMLVTVMTAVYQVVSDECLWLALVVCFICCSAPFIVCFILGHEVLFIPL